MRIPFRDVLYDYRHIGSIAIATGGRVVAIALVCLAAGLLYVHEKIASPFFQRAHDWERWLLLAIPIACFLTALVSSIVAILPIERGIARGTLYGVVLGSGLFLAMMSWMLWPGSVATLADGVAYWSMVSLPSFWLGLPLIIFGGLVGAKCGGAPIPIPVLVVLGLVVFWVPLWLLGAVAIHFILS